MKKFFLAFFCAVLFMTCTVYAADLTWLGDPEYRNQSILLEEGITSSKDVFYSPVRGEYLSFGTTEIVNQRDGSIYVCVDTYAHINVDLIRHAVFLDQWDDKRGDWIKVGSWEFEKTKEEENGELSELVNSLTITGYPANKYYRVRGLHMVEIGDEIEGCATETHGVLITKD